MSRLNSIIHRGRRLKGQVPATRRRFGLVERLELRLALSASSIDGKPYIDIGPSDSIAWDQPRVTVEFGNDQGESLGPGIFSTWLLDTGANTILAFQTAIDDMNQFPPYYETEGLFEELGVGGFSLFDISAPYQFDFAGNSGERNSLEETRIISDDTRDISIFGPWGIVGMPAMTERVTTLDFTNWTTIEELEIFMEVDFPPDLPEYDGPRYSVQLDNRVEFFPDEHVVAGDHPPIWADVPFLTGQLQHNGVVAEGDMLFDTGAQVSILSSGMAFDLGLDSNNDGNLDSLDASFARTETVGGISGFVEVPVFLIDEVHVPTLEGPDLVWTDLQWLVLDVHPDIEAVFGFDNLTSGWIEAFGRDGESGYIMKSQLDFRGYETTGIGTWYVDINPEIFSVVDPNGPGAVIEETGDITVVSETGVSDSYTVRLSTQPAADVRIDLFRPDQQTQIVSAADGTSEFLIFTPENWSIPQTVLVNAVDDTDEESFHRSYVRHLSTSQDPDYQDVGMPRIVLNIVDDDYPGVMLIPTDGATEVSEAGQSDVYSVVLTSAPALEVSITIEHVSGQVTAVSEATGSTTLIFTPENWNIPQNVLVQAVEDAIEEGMHRAYITHKVSTSDANWAEVFALQEIVFISEASGPTDILLDGGSIPENTETSTRVSVGTLSTVDPDVNATHTYELVSDQGANDNNLFEILGSELFIKSGVMIDFETRPHYIVRVRSTNDDQASVERDLQISVENLAEIVQIIVGDGSAQRSSVGSLRVVFDSAVNVSEGAFEVLKRGAGGGSVGFASSSELVNGATVTTIDFNGSFSHFGSLIDGNYQLTVNSSLITDASGNAIDGDQNGVAGGEFVFGDSNADTFFRYYGDVNGDRGIGTYDFGRLRSTYGRSQGHAHYLDYFDLDNDDHIGLAEFTEFRSRFGQRLAFE